MCQSWTVPPLYALSFIRKGASLPLDPMDLRRFDETGRTILHRRKSEDLLGYRGTEIAGELQKYGCDGFAIAAFIYIQKEGF